MDEELKKLYQLQRVDLELDELDDRGGELPTEVEALKKRGDALKIAAATEEKKLRELRKSRTDTHAEMQSLTERKRTLNERLRTVRNNREYDATTTEIEAADAEEQRLARYLVTLDTQEATVIKDIDTLSRQRDEAIREHEEKSSVMATIRETNADEITALKEKKAEMVGQISPDLLRKYEHIRNAYSDAVVKVRKGACSGCFRALPPQTLVEMRRGEQLFTCQHCHRIVVLEELVAPPTVATE
ncbi:MAG: hypothetical protein IPM61_02335 [Chlorobi bacterium]|nr:MAG: Zn-ribbon protein [Chlorobi bacterium OLB7]MBK8910144.1 hypothetical protein [Chlorobiota bacterium]MBX7217676.1 hypothetical protein [Candidatus Kapabacteria bacterium]